MVDRNFWKSLLIILLHGLFVEGVNAQVIERSEYFYGSDKLQSLDVFTSEDSTEKLNPVHIFIHGGAWRAGDKKRFSDMGDFYAKKGAVFVSINYRLYPKDLHPAQIEDCASAIKWVVENIGQHGGDVNRLYLSGHSAGAHLAALLVSDPQYLSAYDIETDIFDGVFPVDTASFDFTKKTDSLGLVVRMVNKTIQKNFGAAQEQLKQASPAFQAPRNLKLPAFVLFVTSKRPGAVEQTQNYAQVLKQSGAPTSEVHVVNGLTHREMALAMYDENSIVAQTILSAMN